MGNCLRASQAKTVEIVKPDGKVLEYPNRVKVGKVLTDFSGYGISENLRQPPLWQLLRPETALRCGRSYFLVPLSPLNNLKKKKKVRFVDEVMDSSSSVEHEDAIASSNPPGEVVRIKMVVSKKELMEMMGRESCDSIRDELTCRILRFRDRSSGGGQGDVVVDNQEEDMV